MGYIKHDAVIVTFADYALTRPWMPDIAAFVASMPEEFRPLVAGPIRSSVNGYVTYVFAPDGSKIGWETSERASEWRQRFAGMFAAAYEDGSTPFDVVRVSYGGDYRYELQEPSAVYMEAVTTLP